MVATASSTLFALQTGTTDLFASSGAGEIFLLARILFGGVLAFMGLNHFTNVDDMTGYAEMKDVPAPRLLVLGSGATVLLGGLAIVLGAFPVLGAAAIAAFLLISGVQMHDFWNVDDPQQQQTEMTQFLKNIVQTGGALAFLAVGTLNWPYALNIGLF